MNMTKKGKQTAETSPHFVEEKRDIRVMGIFGPPCGGKDAQVEKLVERFGDEAPEILGCSTLIRKKLKTLSLETVQKIQEEMGEGKNVSKELLDVTAIVRDAIFEILNKSGTQVNIVLNGFPRTENQGEELLELFQEIQQSPNVDFATELVALRVPTEDLWSRAQHRGREDSVRSVFDERQTEYQGVTEALKILRNGGYEFAEVLAGNEFSPNQVFGAVQMALKKSRTEFSK